MQRPGDGSAGQAEPSTREMRADIIADIMARQGMHAGGATGLRRRTMLDWELCVLSWGAPEAGGGAE